VNLAHPGFAAWQDMEKICNETNPVKDLTRREENSLKIEEDNMRYQVLIVLGILSVHSLLGTLKDSFEPRS
jgi:hypothetical protein